MILLLYRCRFSNVEHSIRVNGFFCSLFSFLSIFVKLKGVKLNFIRRKRLNILIMELETYKGLVDKYGEVNRMLFGMVDKADKFCR